MIGAALEHLHGATIRLEQGVELIEHVVQLLADVVGTPLPQRLREDGKPRHLSDACFDVLRHAPRRRSRNRQDIGPPDLVRVIGIGHHALAVAPSLLPGGTLDVLDLQQEMLDAVARRAAAAGVTNVVPRQGNAHELPYPDATFDAAYLSAVLGEIPDQARALEELRRVLKSGGRLVVAEVLLDPDYVPLSRLRDEARRAGFVFEEKLGPGFAYLARFRASPDLLLTVVEAPRT